MNFDLSVCDYLVITGSKLYGYATAASDTDLRGFYLQSINDLLSCHPWQQWSSSNEDTQVYSLHKFLKDLQRGNMQLLELLFVDQDSPQRLFASRVGTFVASQRNNLISSKHVSSAMGFAQSEWRKVRCVQQVMKYDSKSQEDILKDLQGVFQLDSVQIREIYDIIFIGRKDDPRKEQQSINNIAGRRKEEYEKYGYCAKNASHCIRLLDEARSLIEHSVIFFPSLNLDLLRSIRNGQISFQEIEIMYNEREKWLLENRHNTTLPDKISTDFINNVIMQSFEIKYGR